MNQAGKMRDTHSAPILQDKVCDCGCGAIFTPKRRWQRFYSDACRENYHARRLQAARAAAPAAIALSATTCAGKILESIQRRPGSTTRELAQHFGLDRHMAASRMAELAGAGKVKRGAEKRQCTVSKIHAWPWYPC